MAQKRKKTSGKKQAKTKAKTKAKTTKKGQKRTNKKISKAKKSTIIGRTRGKPQKTKTKPKHRILHKKDKQTRKKPARDKQGRFVSSKPHKRKVLVTKDKPKRDRFGRFVSVVPQKHKVLGGRRDTKRHRTKPKSLDTKKRSKKRIHVEPQKIRRYKVPFFDVPQGSPDGYTEGVEYAPEAFMTAFRANRKSPDFALPEAFEAAFIAALRKGPFEAEDILIYRFGIIIRPRKGTFASEDKQFIANILKDIPGSSVHHVKEQDTFSLRINLGSPVKGELSGIVSDEINKYKHLLAEIYENVISEFGLTEWFSFWDTEEAMYE